MEQRSFDILNTGSLRTLSLSDIPVDIDFDLSLSDDAAQDISDLEKCSTLSEVEMGKFMVG